MSDFLWKIQLYQLFQMAARDSAAVINPRSALEQKLFTMFIYTAYWKDKFSNVIYA